MDDIIHLLPDSVANQIAAGEVVQRPASIIKEMVENSLDADARNVQVLIVDGGKTNVQVIDDGKGMSETDARLSFERHATSKILKASDLFSLCTMGFRGEALASIAAVSQVDLKTRRAGDDLGTYIRIAGSNVECQEPVVCPVGSNFSVKNLFFNVPARRKFLKSNQTELSNIVSDFQRIVLVHPEVAFTLHNNGVEMFRLPQTTVRQRIIDVFGKKINQELLPLEVETSIVSISGYVGKPESRKKKGAHQFFFVNGRFMRHPYFHSAVMRAFDNLIPAGEHVSYFIYFAVEPSTIDVNVHPTKTEIKFDNEQMIWQVLSAAVRETIGKHTNVQMIDFDVDDSLELPAMGMAGDTPVQPRLSAPTYNPFNSGGASARTAAPRGWEQLYDMPMRGKRHDKPSELPAELEGLRQSSLNSDEMLLPSAFSAEQPEIPSLPRLSDFDTSVPKFQYLGQYIVLPSRQGLMLVDQHRAHVNVLFHQNMRCMNANRRPTQKELFPMIVQFDKMEAVVLDDMMDELSSLGFELSNLGGGSYSVNGVPGGIEGLDVDAMLHDMIQSAMEHTADARQEMQEALALSMARKAAIVRGQVLTAVETEQLLADLFALPTPARTPDGHVVYVVVDNKSVSDLFKS